MRSAVVVLAFLLAGCNRGHEGSAADREHHGPAYEAGRAAREIAKEGAKAAKAAGREIQHGAKEAREGWKDKSREDRAKGKQ